VGTWCAGVKKSLLARAALCFKRGCWCLGNKAAVCGGEGVFFCAADEAEVMHWGVAGCFVPSLMDGNEIVRQLLLSDGGMATAAGVTFRHGEDSWCTRPHGSLLT
jgi:hypothetical protein